MGISEHERRHRGIVAALLCAALALLFASSIAWVGHHLIVGYFRQEEITFWVALSIAVLVWFIEEMLHLTIPCRRLLHRFAYRLTEYWVRGRDRESR